MKTSLFLSVESWPQSLDELAQPGKVILLKKSDHNDMGDYFISRGYMIRDTKKPSIELYRALGLNTRKDHSKPRKLVIHLTTLSALTRSLTPLIEHRLKFDDPVCLLFADDELVEKYSATKVQVKRNHASDPITSLLESTENEPVVQQLSTILIGSSKGIQFTRAMIFKATRSKSPVLILGESGTGKELIARLVFEHANNHKNPLIVVNCSSIPNELFESEVFGHIKGSFTNALKDKTGLYEEANGGTLFLDEVGDLSLPNQAKLLRAIENGEIRRVGSNETRKVDVRIIAATNRNLNSMIKQGTFREDLFYRLNSLTIFSTPLREHPEDIPIIATAIWKYKLERKDVLSSKMKEYLKRFSWPGNVRELKTVLISINDIFPDEIPGPEHIIALKAFQKNTLNEARNESSDDFNAYLKAQCRLRVIEVQNIMRAIKIELRPLINATAEVKSLDPHLLKDFLRMEVAKLEELCREPIFFKSREFFDKITRFRYLLDKILSSWPAERDVIYKIWKSEMQALYENIDQEIFDIVWLKMDL